VYFIDPANEIVVICRHRDAVYFIDPANEIVVI